MGTMTESQKNLHSEWTAHRHSVEECKAEMEKLETYVNEKEVEQKRLEEEVSRMKRAVINGGYTDSPSQKEEEDNLNDDTPATPHPSFGYSTPAYNQQLEEEQQQQRQAEEERKWKEQQERDQEIQAQQNQQEEAKRQQEERQRYQEEIQRQQEEMQRQVELQGEQEELQRQQVNQDQE